ncbi:hypothetical protein LCGC14_0702480 [marine sediment metagenome]|uniref:Uncharacterized protein n=1 Tax=marine sediment metagenome TaxID=412755 RepID=A0A0F9QHF9_9ZZZZ
MRRRDEGNNDYERDVRIDPLSLDVEWLDQPRRYQKYSDLLAAAKRVLGICKSASELVKAETALKIRKDLMRGKTKEYDLHKDIKINNDIINNLVTTHKDVKAAEQESTDAYYQVDVLVGAVRAMDIRKAALENLVRLGLGGYFAMPTEPRDIQQQYRSWEEVNKQGHLTRLKTAKQSRETTGKKKRRRK